MVVSINGWSEAGSFRDRSGQGTLEHSLSVDMRDTRK
jgi:hypothetical protein